MIRDRSEWVMEESGRYRVGIMRIEEGGDGTRVEL